mmetsp:Transcript_18134/g.25432  ORF Transcript_18134/g.25432 Transcript_18134/m.25432 type:complete len:86 (-) Transcript_18134:837-1094(-)
MSVTHNVPYKMDGTRYCDKTHTHVSLSMMHGTLKLLQLTTSSTHRGGVVAVHCLKINQMTASASFRSGGDGIFLDFVTKSVRLFE